MAVEPRPLQDARVIAPCLGARFSGINATITAVLPALARHVRIAALGFHLPPHIPRLPLFAVFSVLRAGRRRIWHARRNVDMLVGLFLKHVLRFPLILLWTSAASRRHGWLTRFCYARMDEVIATSEEAAAAIARPARVVPHGVDVRVFHPPACRDEARRARGLSRRRTLAVLGRVRPQKGTGDVVNALLAVLPRHAEWGAVIVGEATPEHRAFERRLRQAVHEAGLDDRVRFVGFVPDVREIPAWYRAVDLVVCASRIEGFGLTCLEAMASGCPVVATRAGAWPRIVSEGENGWLCRPSDAADLARALDIALATDETTLWAMGERARRVAVERFSVEGECQELLSVYDGLFRRHGEPGIA